MALNAQELAQKIWNALDVRDVDGSQLKVTDEIQAYANAIVTTLQSANFAHDVVEADTTPNGAPITNGRAFNGKFKPEITSLVSTWTSKLSEAFSVFLPDEPDRIIENTIESEASISLNFMQESVIINFEPNTITGISTAINVGHTIKDGPLQNGAGTDGKFVMTLPVSDWVNRLLDNYFEAEIRDNVDRSVIENVYLNVKEHIETRAEGQYPTGFVTGICPGTGGPLIGGKGEGGIVL